MNCIKKILKISLLNILVLLLLLEVTTNIFYYFAPESNLTIFIKEANRRTYSNLRVHNRLLENNGRRIKLPEIKKSEILVVGDSFPFGAFVKAEHSFPDIIQEKLSKDVINLGIPGTYPKFYNRMIQVGRRYRPDLIIYCVYANDLFFDHLFDNTKESFSFNNYQYSFDELLFTDHFDFKHRMARKKKIVLNNLKSLQVVRRLMDFLVLKAGGVLQGMQPVKHKGHISYCLPDFWYSVLNLHDERVSASFCKTIHYIKNAHRYVTQRDADLIVVLIPCKEMIYGSLTDMFNSDELSATYSELASQLQKQNIPVLNLIDFMMAQELANKDEPLFLRTDVHLTEAGHMAVAEGIVQYLQKNFY